MSSPLAALIRQEIAVAGPIPFRRFMELALYHPGLGYYSSGRARIGRGGDFFTNVSVGPLFGRLLARQLAEMWGNLAQPEDFTIVEQGANNGQLAADILGGLRDFAPDCFEATRYWIVEPNEQLALQQRTLLAGEAADWAPSIEALRPFAGVHVSNELIDAFPVHVVEWDGNAWQEHYVEVDGDEFVFVKGVLSSPALALACAKIPQPLPNGYVTEVNVAAAAWITGVSARVEDGYVLAVDYGHLREDYYHPDRATGTLSAYLSHRRERNPLSRPGEIDLTAHVDFTSLIDAGTAAGLRLCGYTDQHHFMVALGTDYFAAGANPAELRAFQTLMHPTMLGQAFKVVAFASGNAPERLSGFRYARPM
jgi:SAM-dependent MidA family methyltransferase